MARVFEYGSGNLIVRSPSGEQVFSSADRMIAQLDEVTYTGVTVAFPIVSGEVTQFGSGADFGFVRRVVPAVTLRTESVVLGPYSGADVPDIIFARVRCSSFALGGLNIDQQFSPFFGMTDWVSMPGGSAFVEFGVQWGSGPNYRRWLYRHIDFAVSGGNWLLQKRQSNAAYTTVYRNTAGTTASTFTMDVAISYGFLDL